MRLSSLYRILAFCWMRSLGARLHCPILNGAFRERGKQVVEYTLYKMPNAEVMAAVDPRVIKDYPTLAISPAELFEPETQTDLGEEGTVLWAEAATEIKA